jgi:copper chaperone CopZ
MQAPEIKYCQACIERGYSKKREDGSLINPNPATREWQPGIYYCDDCFNTIINNLTNIEPKQVQASLSKIDKGAILPQIYSILNVPIELQFDSVDETCKHRDQFFTFHAPANINKTLEQLSLEREQMRLCLFQFQYKIASLETRIGKLKDERRAEKNLKSYDDSKEKYSKPKSKATSIIADGDSVKKEKAQKKLEGGILGITAEDLKLAKEIEEKKRRREFHILSGNCPECGDAMPCEKHPNARII